ncbi:MAG: hypothetical protein OXI58_16895 [Gemmatimonadota bacterium]|nr:hypothetical protein [Gemmatimonadota bacterium]
MRGYIQFLLWGLLLLGVDGCTPALPPGPLRIQITGEEFIWQLRYPGPDGALHTADDITKPGKELHLPLGIEVEIELTSRDYIYTFALPHLDLHQVAVPDLTFALTFTPQTTGVFAFVGDQMCGFEHESLNGRVVVESPAAFVDWLTEP